MLSRAQSAECLSDPRSMADAYEIYYATFIAIKSGHRIALSRTLLRSLQVRAYLPLASSTSRAARPGVVHRPAVVAGEIEIEIASSEDSTTARGGLSHRYEAVYMADGDEGRSGGRGPRDDQRGAERRLRERGGRTKRRARARLSAGREGKRRRLRKGEVGGGYKVTRVQNRASASASERANERVRAR